SILLMAASCGRLTVGVSSTKFSASANLGSWEVFAGSTEVGDGGLATHARFGQALPNYTTEMVGVTSNGDVYVGDITGVRRIDATTGNIETYLKFGTEANLSGTIGSSTPPTVYPKSMGGTDQVVDSN